MHSEANPCCWNVGSEFARTATAGPSLQLSKTLCALQAQKTVPALWDVIPTSSNPTAHPINVATCFHNLRASVHPISLASTTSIRPPPTRPSNECRQHHQSPPQQPFPHRLSHDWHLRDGHNLLDNGIDRLVHHTVAQLLPGSPHTVKGASAAKAARHTLQTYVCMLYNKVTGSVDHAVRKATTSKRDSDIFSFCCYSARC